MAEKSAQVILSEVMTLARDSEDADVIRRVHQSAMEFAQFSLRIQDMISQAFKQIADSLSIPELAAIREALAELDTPSKHQRHLEALHAIRKQQKVGKDE